MVARTSTRPAARPARAATGRPGVIAFSGAFHGRTNLCMGLTGKVVPYKKGFGPFTPGFKLIPYGDAAALEAAITDNTMHLEDMTRPPEACD